MKKGILVFSIILIVAMLFSAAGCVYAPTDSHDRTFVTAPKSSAPVTSAYPYAVAPSLAPSVSTPVYQSSGFTKNQVAAALRSYFPGATIRLLGEEYGFCLPAYGNAYIGGKNGTYVGNVSVNQNLAVSGPTYRVDYVEILQ